MRPFLLKNPSAVYTARGQWDAESYGECAALPVLRQQFDVDVFFTSFWSLTWRERLAVLFGAKVSVTIAGFQPAISLAVTRPERA